jgi:hypothetical protein
MNARTSTRVAAIVTTLLTGSVAGVAAQSSPSDDYDPLQSIQVPAALNTAPAAVPYDPLSSIRVPVVRIAVPAPVELLGD